MSSPEGIFPLIFREGGREEERQEKETHMGRLPPTWSPVGDEACNRGTSPPLVCGPTLCPLSQPARAHLARRVARTEASRLEVAQTGPHLGKWFELDLTLSLTCRGRATSLHTGLWLLRNQPSVSSPSRLCFQIAGENHQESCCRAGWGLLLPGPWTFITSLSGHTKLSAEKSACSIWSNI